jgi:hypothetical protein
VSLEQKTQAGTTPNESDAKADADASDASSNASSGDLYSDDEDVFKLRPAEIKTLPDDYSKSYLEQFRRAVMATTNLLRSEPLLLLLPGDSTAAFEDLDSGILLPSWHCPFADCDACGMIRINSDKEKKSEEFVLPKQNSVSALRQHIWGNSELGMKGLHKAQLTDIFHEEFPEFDHPCDYWQRQETCFAVLEEAIATKERENVPLVGMARDRRALQHLDEVCTESNLKVLMCLICNSKHIYYHNFDKYGKEYNAGRIDYRVPNKDRSLLQDMFQADEKEDSFFDHNLSYKKIKKAYGNASARDPELNKETRTEWNAQVLQKDGSSEEALCNPEDVKLCSECTPLQGKRVCPKCSIPICNECWRYVVRQSIRHAGIPKIPKALANDNFIGYMHRLFLEKNVTWLEATIACPFFTGMVTYYIEGPQRRHLMEESVAQPEAQYGIRGNVFSNLLDWEGTHAKLKELTSNGKLTIDEWPSEPNVAVHLARVQVRFVCGPEALLNKFKQLKIRAEIVRKVAYLYIEKHLCGLLDAKGAADIQAKYAGTSLEMSLKAHVDARMTEHYPEDKYPSATGAVPTKMHQFLADNRETTQQGAQQSKRFRGETIDDCGCAADRCQ